MSKSNLFPIVGKLLYAKFDGETEKGTKQSVVSLKIDEKTSLYLKKLGVEVSKEKRNLAGEIVDTGHFIKLKSNFAPALEDLNRNPIILSDRQYIKSGTTVSVVTHTYEWKNPQGKKGVSLGLDSLRIPTESITENNLSDIHDQIDVNDLTSKLG